MGTISRGEPGLSGSDEDSTLNLIGNPSSPGTWVAGRYRLESLLGYGGFGQVHRAWDRKLDRVVALKVLTLSTEEPGLGERVPRFEEEARAVAKLDHPHIVPVYDAGTEGQTPWMVMKLIEGSSLRALLHEQGSFSPSRALLLVLQIAKALSHAHRRGIVHRDVKPANILLSRNDGAEHAWLTDFGVAKLLTGLDRTPKGSILGTPSYMSPEQAIGRAVDARADIFSLGCVAAELITGHPPFQGSSVSEILSAIIHLSPELAGFSERAGRGFQAVVERCLAKSPEDRWQTMDEAVRELEALSAAPQAAAEGRARRLWRSNRSPELAWNGLFPVVTEGLRKGFGFSRPVLSGLDLQVPRGAIYAVMGRNGIGKTTLIRTCLGIYRRDAGRVAVFGRDPEREGPAILARVGLVPDALAVDERMKVGELLAFVSRFYPQWDQARCFRLLGRYDLRLDQKIRSLSRGMRTKVSLVMALAHRPDLLILDDPTLGLDAVILEEFVESLEESAREGATILIASHNYSELERIATHAGFLRDGRLFLSDTVANLKARTCEVHLTFPEDVPDFGVIPQFNLVRTSGRHASGVILDHREESLARLRSLAPRDLEVRELSLREIFVHLLR
jgi:ABC-type multidrug transport system ATPase subunit